MIRLFMPCLWGLQFKDRVAVALGKPASLMSLEAYLEAASVRDEALLHLQYLQAVYHIVTGQYPTTTEEALTLGALHFNVKFGEYRPPSHRMGFLGARIVEFIPIKHLRQKELEDWEQSLYDTLRDAQQNGVGAGCSSSGAERKYLDTVYRMVHYGCSFFRCFQRSTRSLPEQTILGIYNRGIHIFDKNRALQRSFTIEEVLRWGFKPAVLFYFEVRPEPDIAGPIEFETTDGQRISELLTDYALAFLQVSFLFFLLCAFKPFVSYTIFIVFCRRD